MTSKWLASSLALTVAVGMAVTPVSWAQESSTEPSVQEVTVADTEGDGRLEAADADKERTPKVRRGHRGHGWWGPGHRRVHGPHFHGKRMFRGWHPGAADRGRGGGRWMALPDPESLPADMKTPELEESLRRYHEARRDALEASRAAAEKWQETMKARWEAAGAWLEAAHRAGKLTDEQYERIQQRREQIKDAVERGAMRFRPFGRAGKGYGGGRRPEQPGQPVDETAADE